MIFADDIRINLESPDGNMQTAVQQCQVDIDHLVRTSESLGLHMNAAKGTVFRFKPRGSVVGSTGKSPYHVNNFCLIFQVLTQTRELLWIHL